MSEVKSTAHYRPETRLVHSGTLRSQYGETSEALFLTQGFVYDTAEQCEAAAHEIRASNPNRDLNDLVDPKGVYVAASCEPSRSF